MWRRIKRTTILFVRSIRTVPPKVTPVLIWYTMAGWAFGSTDWTFKQFWKYTSLCVLTKAICDVKYQLVSLYTNKTIKYQLYLNIIKSYHYRNRKCSTEYLTWNDYIAFSINNNCNYKMSNIYLFRFVNFLNINVIKSINKCDQMENTEANTY